MTRTTGGRWRVKWRGLAKRLLDISFSVLAILVTAPLQASVAVVIRIQLGRPVLFRQARPGRDGRSFTLVKFRTMRPVEGHRVNDADRLSQLGKFLRASSLDELPSLWNVFKGDMSLVGPRPLLIEYLVLYDARQSRRHEVRPGITGLAQVNGRNEVSWTRRLALDIYYVENRSMKLDIDILLRTFLLVLRRTGVTAKGHVTMVPFTGAPPDEEVGSDPAAQQRSVAMSLEVERQSDLIPDSEARL